MYTCVLQHVIPVESPWQHGMVDRHGQASFDIINVVRPEARVVGPEQVNYALLRASFAKQRRPERTATSPRAHI